MQRRRRGFIILFGSRGIVSNDSAPPVETTCPNCGQPAQIYGKTVRSWFTIFFLPIFPISGAQRFSQCSACGAQFPVVLEDLKRSLARSEQQSNQQAIALYNSMRASPANSITLNELMLTYAGMKEYEQAISAAREFADALHASEQCMTTLGRIYLAIEKRAEAMQWFDAAIERNASLGEAHYWKGVAHLTATPPDYSAALSCARQARNLGHPHAEALVNEAQEKLRQ
jgi:tetratricopeptide (TPR) repeat protein